MPDDPTAEPTVALEAPRLIVETFPVGPLQCNCTILGDPETGHAVIVDPGGDTDRILSRLRTHGLKATLLLHTHAHIDHILATRAVHEQTGATIALHRGDLTLYEGLIQQAAMLASWGMPIPTPDAPLPVEHFLVDGEELTAGALSIEVLHTPGHTEGSCCFGMDADVRRLLIAGDTLFKGSIGRTDLPGGDSAKIVQSIKERLYRRDEDTMVLTGHGEPTTIGQERRANAFVRG